MSDYVVGSLTPSSGGYVPTSRSGDVPHDVFQPAKKQPSLTVDVNVTGIKEAVEAMNELTEAAKRAQKAIAAISGVLLEGDSQT